MKTIDTDDPRITAYALGELEPAEHAEVEALVLASREAKAEADAIRETAALLGQEFGAAAGDSFSTEERDEVLAAGKVVTPEPDAFGRFSRRMGIVGVAACLVGVGTFGAKQLMQQDEAAIKEGLEAGERSAAWTPGEKAPGAGGEKQLSANLSEAMLAGETDDAVVEREELALAPDAERAQAAAARPVLDKPASLSKSPPPAAPAESAGAPGKAAGKKTESAANMPAADFAAADGVAPTDGLVFGQPGNVADPAGLGGRARRWVDAKPAPAASPLMRATAPGSAGPPKANSGPYGGVDIKAVEEQLVERKTVTRGLNLGGVHFDERDSKGRVADGESYAAVSDTPFVTSLAENVSTFAIDVDTGSYSNIRRFIIRRGQLPPKDAVRVEEMINYFDYDYPEPVGEHPFGVTTEVASCPWADGHRLVRIGLKGKSMAADERPASNLVFLVDVSGSMNNQEKLPLLKESLVALVQNLNEGDRIGIVTYAGQAKVAMAPKRGNEKEVIIDAIESLRAGGGTNGGDGIAMAYKLAKENFVEGGTNRVVLATDGDFNVGTTNTEALVEAVKRHGVEDKIHLTILGFGEGNLQDARMEQIANKGDGNYFYIDNSKEGRRVLVDKLSATLVTIAKDVKIQVDFNPGKVHSYRLIGYANRRMANEDFRNDKKDAGEIGAGHTVTALYEIVPAGSEAAKALELAQSTGSRYVKEERKEGPERQLVESDELLTVLLRYKSADAGPKAKATEFEKPLQDEGKEWGATDGDFRFAAAVAGFGMQLRDSLYKGELDYGLLLELAGEGVGDDENGLRKEFIGLVEKASELAPAER